MRNADLEVTRFTITPGHMGTSRCQCNMAIERGLGQSGRIASVDPTEPLSNDKLSVGAATESDEPRETGAAAAVRWSAWFGGPLALSWADFSEELRGGAKPLRSP